MIPTQPFGKTGHDSTRTIFGAAALWGSTEEEAEATLALLDQHGINHIDTAAIYGRSERRVGAWMPAHRERFFLATKTGERTYDKAKAGFEHSLERLQTDHVAIEARTQGLTRFIGVTGHGVQAPMMHRRSLERFAFDSILTPYNFPMMQNPQYAADLDALVALCQERGVAVQTIKAITLAPWAEGQERTATTWYEPLREQADIDCAVSWLLGRPGVFLNTVGDVSILPAVFAAAEQRGPRPSDAEMEALVQGRRMAPLFT